MASLQLVAFAFLAGLTLCGVLGSLMELATGRRLSFTDPFVSPRYVLRSLACTMAAGPLMLVNDALDAWRSDGVSTAMLVSCAVSSAAWLLATGIVALDLASRTAALLS